MNLLEITLLVLGIIIILISCIIMDRSGRNHTNEMKMPDSVYSEDDIKRIEEELKTRLLQISEENIEQADDNLSRISNEKIMAVNEFSDQILEKIKNNHEEVVFLYDMLNDKEKELKSFVNEIKTFHKVERDITNKKKKIIKMQSKTKPINGNVKVEAQDMKQVSTSTNKDSQVASEDTDKNSSVNNNSQIIELYNKGKSIVEISKFLGIGQGEVKLVIDLFCRKK